MNAQSADRSYYRGVSNLGRFELGTGREGREGATRGERTALSSSPPLSVRDGRMSTSYTVDARWQRKAAANARFREKTPGVLYLPKTVSAQEGSTHFRSILTAS